MLKAEEKSRFYVAQQYMQAAKNLIEGMLKDENPSVISSDHEISDDELAEGLRNSSQLIILPALFCLYQGIELILKGFINNKGKLEKNDLHKGDELCNRFSELYKEELELSALFNKFMISPPKFITEYMQLNNITSIINFYNSLRYPDKNNGETNDYYPLMYTNNELFLPQVEELNQDIEQLLILSVKLFWLLEDTQ